MPEQPLVAISFKDLATEEALRASIERRCRALADEFPETTRLEITVAADGAGHVAHARVSGRDTQIDARATAIELEPAVDRALDRVRHQLRSVHDKRIFTRRREARRTGPKHRP